MYSISSINQFPIITEPIKKSELEETDVLNAVSILKPYHPWVTKNDISRPDNIANDYIGQLFSGGLNDEDYNEAVINSITSNGPASPQSQEIEILNEFERRNITKLYVPVYSYIFALNKFGQYKDERLENLTPEKRLELFTDTYNSIIQGEQFITNTRWQAEDELFGKPIEQEPEPLVIFSPILSHVGKAAIYPWGFLSIINLNRLEDTFSNKENQEIETILSEILAHERKHYVPPEARKGRKNFKYEEIFTELTGVVLPKRQEQQPIRFISRYTKGANHFMRKLDELPSHINKDDLYRSLYLTANTRQLYGSDRKGIPYFGTFYEKVTGVKFENTPLGINWTDEEIWTVSEAQKDNTQISTISPS